MDWGRFRFFWAEVAQNFTRNLTMAVTAVGTVAVSVVLLGTILFLHESFSVFMKQVVGQVTIAAYLKDSAPKTQVDGALRVMKTDPRVETVTFVSKKQAMDGLRARLRGQMNLNIINTNPLPDAIMVHPVDPNDSSAIAKRLQSLEAVGSVNYQSDITQKLLRVETVLGAVGIGVVSLLLAATALLIYNTIRLTVFARSREIHIMQLVGATRWTVRWPFVFEGILTGLAGAAIGIALLEFAYRTFAPKIAIDLPFLPFNFAVVPVGTIAFELICTGALVGMLASMLSVSRYLRSS
ncbi:MAG TPA: permease-like cell division protein FtsX [Candidatus Eremiobacteraceae bacterium]|nr:permease-like cell division protein FtsX [Candidatus Eremiobacteraceae bacterium]